MKGMKVYLSDGETAHLPNAGYWKWQSESLKMKKDQHGDTIAIFNLDDVVGLQITDTVEITRRNTNG